jgi:hypothetical protein
MAGLVVEAVPSSAFRVGPILNAKTIRIDGCSLKHNNCILAGGGKGIPPFDTFVVPTWALKIGAPVTRSTCCSIRQCPTVRVSPPET